MATGDPVDKKTMCGQHLSDLEVASEVRMLTRSQLDHEAVCTMARDRIMYLSQQLEKAHKAIEWAMCIAGDHGAGPEEVWPYYEEHIECLNLMKERLYGKTNNGL